VLAEMVELEEEKDVLIKLGGRLSTRISIWKTRKGS